MYIYVKVKVGSKKEKIKEKTPGHFEIDVCQKAERGEANKRILEILSSHFKTKKIMLVNGHRKPSKIFEIK